MILIDHNLTPKALLKAITRLWEVSAPKLHAIEREFDPESGAPVFTIEGKYTARGWTEWTQGFQYGSQILQFDATGEQGFLESGRRNTVGKMAGHVTHFGVHDHGFNNVSTYGNLRRLMNEGLIPENEWERNFYELALKCSGSVQAARWTDLGNDRGYIYSFNGPHSLFADTIRSLRAPAIGHLLGHCISGENDVNVSLLKRLIEHARATARYSVYYGEGRDAYDERGRVAHESIFNVKDGRYRCPNSQQGYSPFTTWTRGLAWIMLGFAEQIEFLEGVDKAELENSGGANSIREFMLKAATAACDFYIENSPADGVPYWDTGAPGLSRMGDYLGKASDPFNGIEPVDSSAAAIAAQGLMRLGAVLGTQGDGRRYHKAGLTVLRSLTQEPYLSADPKHHGLILHSVYHRPNGWDHAPEGSDAPYGESSMWGDYHAREAALYVQRIADGKPYLKFY